MSKNLNAGSFSYEMGPFSLPEKMNCKLFVQTIQHVNNTSSYAVRHLIFINLFVINIKSFDEYFDSHLFVASVVAFIVRSACSAAAGEVLRVILFAL